MTLQRKVQRATPLLAESAVGLGGEYSGDAGLCRGCSGEVRLLNEELFCKVGDDNRAALLTGIELTVLFWDLSVGDSYGSTSRLSQLICFNWPADAFRSVKDML